MERLKKAKRLGMIQVGTLKPKQSLLNSNANSLLIAKHYMVRKPTAF
jgi:hypothetical protein